MNTEVQVLWPGPPLQPWFQQAERTLSRFDPASALSRVNRSQGAWYPVPRLLYIAIRQALQAAAATGGAFDPTMLPALEASGYSRSFELGPTAAAPPVPAGRWREVRLNVTLQAVWLPPGVRLDLGGIGKGLAVDLAMKRLRAAPRAMVNAGGDLAVRTAREDGPLLIEVEDPLQPARALAAFGLCQGAAATSSVLGRRWGQGLHHIIDPASGRPANTDVLAATVVARRAAQAEVLSKACIVLGRERGLRLLAEHGAHGVLVGEQGNVVSTSGMREVLHEPD